MTTIIRKVLIALVLVSIMAVGVYAVESIWTQRVLGFGMTVESVDLDFDEMFVDIGYVRPGQLIEESHTRHGDSNIYGLTSGNLSLSTSHANAIKSFYVKGTVIKDWHTDGQEFEGYLLQDGRFSRLVLDIPEGGYSVDIYSTIEVGMLEECVDVDAWIRFGFNQPCDLPIGNVIGEEEGPEPFVEILWPNGGEKLVAGGKYHITWDSQGVDELSIMWSRYSHNGYGIEGGTIVYQTRAPVGSYTWQVPSDLVSSDYYKVTMWDSSSINGLQDESDEYFSIAESYLPIDEYTSIDISGEFTFTSADSPLLIVSDIDYVYVKADSKVYDCKVNELSCVSEYGDTYSSGNIVSVEITEIETELYLLLTYTTGKQEFVDIPATRFRIVYESIDDPSVTWTDDDVTIDISAGLG